MKDGRPAFPDKEELYEAGYATGRMRHVQGMSLRDYFAAKAMQGLIAGALSREFGDYVNEAVARNAYELADAMLAEMSK